MTGKLGSTELEITEKTKKLLIVAHNHPKFFPGGAEIFAYDLFQAIRSQTHYTPFFLGAATKTARRQLHGGTLFQALVDTPDEALFWGEAFDPFYQSQKVLEFMWGDFKNFLQRLQPDVIHFQHTFRLGLEALQIARQTLPNVKIVYTLHEFLLICYHHGMMIRKDSNELCESASTSRCHQCFPDISPQKFMMREAFIQAHLKLVDRFVSPSQFLAQRFVDWGIPEDKMRVMENGRPISKPAPHRALPEGETRNVFGFFGQINPYKGLLLAFKAVSYLVKQGFTDFRLEVFGSVSMTPGFQQEFFELLEDCQENVTFHGGYKNDEIPELIKSIDWVIVPSTWWENSPLVIQEVFTHKRPIICSNIGGMAEKVEHNVTGLHFRVGDRISLAETLKKASCDEELWEKLVQNIRIPLSIEDCAQEHVQLYDRLSSN